MMGRGKAACSSRNPPPHLGLFPFPRPPVPNQHLALCPIPSAHTPLGISATLVVQRTALDTDQCLRQPPPPKTPDRSSKHLHLDVHRHLGLGRFKTEFLIYHLNVLHLKLSPSQLTAISFFSLLRPKTLGQSLAPLPSASHTPSVRQPCGLYLHHMCGILPLLIFATSTWPAVPWMWVTTFSSISRCPPYLHKTHSLHSVHTFPLKGESDQGSPLLRTLQNYPSPYKSQEFTMA